MSNATPSPPTPFELGQAHAKLARIRDGTEFLRLTRIAQEFEAVEIVCQSMLRAELRRLIPGVSKDDIEVMCNAVLVVNRGRLWTEELPA